RIRCGCVRLAGFESETPCRQARRLTRWKTELQPRLGARGTCARSRPDQTLVQFPDLATGSARNGAALRWEGDQTQLEAQSREVRKKVSVRLGVSVFGDSLGSFSAPRAK